MYCFCFIVFKPTSPIPSFPLCSFFGNSHFTLMAEYRTFFIGLELILNALFPTLLLSNDLWILVPYACSILFPASVLLYIYFKKRLYFKKYLCRAYVPSLKLIVFTQSINFIILFTMYYFIILVPGIFSFNALWAVSHLMISAGIYFLLLFQKERNRAVIAYTRHQYKLGIIARDIGGENGLKKGQPVEIIEEIPGGYVVKDSSKHDYQVKTEDIESIIDVV
ncbi:uncharacterized protein VICG_01850 [Vittaforma corneae ATCC 50505]|uniref:Uncharacterized protein n=1 Tax=Vittaforma corneae (strain ATCC 50505) TaxID=993615 RepID=L2GJY3_VITCO|nr:uncharacterized protein VICG_01850 [Vittaforma corneae ATCC 50505]ELA41151.1 hypothetical protein VICG_01850 [Vittaforma corneae ATCC 50505]